MRFHGSQSERSSENRDQFSDPPFLRACPEGKKNGKKNGIGERNPTTKNKKKERGGRGIEIRTDAVATQAPTSMRGSCQLKSPGTLGFEFP